MIEPYVAYLPSRPPLFASILSLHPLPARGLKIFVLAAFAV